MGKVPDGGTPEDWTDTDIEGQYNTETGEITWGEIPEPDSAESFESEISLTDNDDDTDTNIEQGPEGLGSG